MKNIQILLFILILFAANSFGQTITNPLDYYPLQVGNKWIYKEVPFNFFENDTSETFRYRYEEIVGDTILNDGQLYFIKKYWYNQDKHSIFQRIDSVTNIIYSEDGIEEYNLAANPDSIWKDNAGIDNMLYYDTTKVGELNIVRPVIILQQGSFYFNRTLAKGIGFCFAEYGDLGLHTLDFLVYAKINGNEFGNTVNVSNGKINTIRNFTIYQNYPNPFNPRTKIKYSIPQMDFVSIKVYDLFGKEIATLVNEEKPTGNYEVDFSGSNLSSGVYFYRIKSRSYQETKKMILLR